MKRVHDLSQLDWKLTGWVPELWRTTASEQLTNGSSAEITAVPAKVPGSVQYSLREAGVIPDWNIGLNYRLCEWVENRHWIYEAQLPDAWIEPGKMFILNCQGLDYCGEVYLNGKLVSGFCGTHVPHVFDLTEHLEPSGNVLRIFFDLSPRWLGQFGCTSKMDKWKPRFNYFWDWTARLVQIGIWDDISLEVTDGEKIDSFRCWTETDAAAQKGKVVALGKVTAGTGATVKISIARDGKTVAEKSVPAASFNEAGMTLDASPVELWWPNLAGEQPLYELKLQLLDGSGKEIDSTGKRVGFREIKWEQCEGSCPDSDPWICVVNGKKVFMQGANWTPIRPNFADLTEADYRKRLELYKDLGANTFRVWGGASLEKEWFYDICDELGLMVWQEFPLSSSTMDCIPPKDEKSISEMAEIGKSYVERRQHHASLIIWCGGNELLNTTDWVPADTSHPMLARLEKVVEGLDPTRRYLATSPSGPRAGFDAANAGKGLHWDVHGPWKCESDIEPEWLDYWISDDSLIRSETGSPGASSAEIIRSTAGECDVMPPVATNPIWRRHMDWWIEEKQFVKEKGRKPETLEEYVEWSQARQAKCLTIALMSAKIRFPRCGGMIFWMGHDCFPCAANTSIIDFNGDPKPAALAVKAIWHNNS
ncbi:MAG: glycoside hydrolase family 2 TIM barrel-domain containing protein [Armatimonadota bacterium]